MAKTVLQYDKIWGNALRGVVREALKTCENGLPGGHHFYITFRTRQPGVDISEALRLRFPDEMTIVLQHQYWDFEVNEDWFAVTLSFNRVNERLQIPYTAVTAFADPFAKFGIQIPTDAGAELPVPTRPDEPETAAQKAPPASSDDGRVVALDAFRKK